MTTLIVLSAIVWVVCGVLAYGTYYAHYQREYPSMADISRDEDRWHAMIVGLSGPIGLIANWKILGFRHGLKFK